jgi:YHS domain-containing protein
MTKLILVALLVLAFYWVFRKVRPDAGRSPRITGAGSKRLVQDPVCKVYILERDAKIATVGGRRFFFCSETCRKQYFKGQL